MAIAGAGRAYTKELINRVASPRKKNRPTTSITVVMNIAEDTVGSTRSRRSSSGTPSPVSPATAILPTIASRRVLWVLHLETLLKPTAECAETKQI